MEFTEITDINIDLEGGQDDGSTQVMSEANETKTEDPTKVLKYTDEDLNNIFSKKLSSKKTVDKMEEIIAKKVEEALGANKGTPKVEVGESTGSADNDVLKTVLERFENLEKQLQEVTSSNVQNKQIAKAKELISVGVDEDTAISIVENWNSNNLDNLDVELFRTNKVVSKVDDTPNENVPEVDDKPDFSYLRSKIDL